MFKISIASLSFPTETEALAALRAAGVVIGTTAEATVNCAGTPPTFFDKWTYRPSDQFHNLYKGMLDVREVTARQAPSQTKDGHTRLDVIRRELRYCEFVGAHAAEWYQRPENKAAFLAMCPSGTLVFLEKYRDADRCLKVVCLYISGNRVCASNFYACSSSEFGARIRFAVRRELRA